MIMDMTSAAESRWYDNPRLSGSPNAGTSHQSAGSTGTANANNGGIVDASDMGAFYSLENAGHRRYYSTGYGPHGNLHFILYFLYLHFFYAISYFNFVEFFSKQFYFSIFKII